LMNEFEQESHERVSQNRARGAFPQFLRCSLQYNGNNREIFMV